ncbi:MAG TPA: hypothetical protein H9679_02585 [Firmicutes bacterium]|nr:hypothetical protein [Bacillota bacterium]
MADYQALYHALFRATEQAVEILIKAQQECEERYISESESPVELLPFSSKSDSPED